MIINGIFISWHLDMNLNKLVRFANFFYSLATNSEPLPEDSKDLTPDKTIVKLAKNDKGLAQNKAEANPKMKSPFLNKILSHAPNYSWIETHYLDKISKPDFKKMTGLEFNDFGDSIRYGLKNVSGNTDLEKPENFDKVEKSDIYKELKRIGKTFKLMPGDLARISSWGTKDGHPILIDAGLTADVFSDYYEDSDS